MEHDEFGKIVQDFTSGAIPFGFAGGLFFGTRNVFMGARAYFPLDGRWLSKDPIRFDGGDTNLYGYVVNDPVNRIDPSGLSYIIYDRSSGVLDVFSGDGALQGSFSAGNNVTSTAPAGTVPAGVFPFSPYMPHPESDAGGSYGSNGNFVFNFPNGSGIGVHSGREGQCDLANRCGVNHATKGCIRSTDPATELIKNLHKRDPLTSIIVL